MGHETLVAERVFRRYHKSHYPLFSCCFSYSDLKESRSGVGILCYAKFTAKNLPWMFCPIPPTIVLLPSDPPVGVAVRFLPALIAISTGRGMRLR